jgi:DNA-3-methyladenine glycosylase II
VTGDSSRPVWLQQARSYLRQADPVLARLIDERPDFDPRAWMTQLPPMDLYGALLFQVTGQQLSVAATRRTLARIEDLFGGHLPAPTELLAVDPGRLREAGLSWRKVGTLRDLAERLTDGRLDQDALSKLPDDELIAELTTITGIGPWTVQGALLIALGREDVVLPGDLALRKAILAAYRLDRLPTQQEVLDIAEKWRPYRSLATSYLFSAAYEPAGAPPSPSRNCRPSDVRCSARANHQDQVTAPHLPGGEPGSGPPPGRKCQQWTDMDEPARERCQTSPPPMGDPP